MDHSTEQPLLGMAAITAAAEAHSTSLALSPVTESHSSQVYSSEVATDPRERVQHQQAAPVKSGRHRRCQENGCNKQCNFGFEGFRALFCSSHKLDGQINVNQRSCEVSCCTKTATFSYDGGKPKYCNMHKLDGMRARHKRPSCSGLGCTRQPIFGYPGQARKACSRHKSSGMESKAVVRSCRQGCGKVASYNYPQQGAKPMYCLDHRTGGMVHLRARVCEADGCSKRASFSCGRGEPPTLCAAHRRPGMIDAKRKVCDEPTCTRPALPHSNGEAKRLCRRHRSVHVNGGPNTPERCKSKYGTNAETTMDGSLRDRQPASPGAMMPQPAQLCDATSAVNGGHVDADARSEQPHCEHPGCPRDPVFAGHSEPSQWPRFCAVHRMDALVDLSVMRCEEDGCFTPAVWGWYGERAARCKSHRQPQMVDVKAQRCRRVGCTRLPYFTSPAGGATTAGGCEGATWCWLHKSDGMLDVKSQRCSEHGCDSLPLDDGRGEDPSLCREHRTSWSHAIETGFPGQMITDADTAEAATVVAGLWADAIGGDWGMGGGGGGGGNSSEGLNFVIDKMYMGGTTATRGRRDS